MLLGDDVMAGVALFLLFIVPMTVYLVIERRRRRRRASRQVLPPPDDPRLRNQFAIRDWKRRRDNVARFIPI